MGHAVKPFTFQIALYYISYWVFWLLSNTDDAKLLGSYSDALISSSFTDYEDWYTSLIFTEPGAGAIQRDGFYHSSIKGFFISVGNTERDWIRSVCLCEFEYMMRWLIIA